MDNSMLSLFDFISLAAGGYALYTWYQLLTTKKLFANSLLIPKDQVPKDCKDSDAYIRYIKPRVLILGVFLALFGLISLVNSNLHLYNNMVDMALTFVAVIVIVWYAVCSVRSFRRYW